MSALIDEEFLTLGISLKALRDLKVDSKEDFRAVREKIKSITKGTTGNRSLASHLYQDEKTRHLVGKADCFVSHAWAVSFGETMTALEQHFKDKPTPFLWISIAMVDQHVYGVDFAIWTEMFKRSLVGIGKALLMLSPVEKPIAISRSWCCYEWVCIAQENGIRERIKVEYCVNPREVEGLLTRMEAGMGVTTFTDIFAGINVESAEAQNKFEEKAILEMMRAVGMKEVNDIIMLNVKNWLIRVASEGEKRVKPGHREGINLLNAKASLHYAMVGGNGAVRFHLLTDDHQGDTDAAQRALLQALDFVRKVPDAQMLVAMLLNNLAELLQSKGNIDGAEPLFCEAIAIWKNTLGNDHPLVTTGLNNLAGLLEAKGDIKGAEPLYREALVMRKKVLGDAHLDVAGSLKSLAGLLREMGDYDRAEPLYREALAIQKKALGDTHPIVAGSLSNLALLLRDKGEFDEGESMCREALRIQERLLGREHPEVATQLNNLAGFLQGKGDYHGAESLFREAIAIVEKKFGRDHPDVATRLNNLGGLMIFQGKLKEARELFEQALRIRREALGNNHPDVATTLWGLASLYKKEGRILDAKALGAQALKITEKALGPNHPDSKNILLFVISLEMMTRQ